MNTRSTGLVIIASMKAMLVSLDRLEGIVKLLGRVNAAPDFTELSELAA